MEDVQHSICWTANYLAGLYYRYAYLEKSNTNSKLIELAKKRTDEVFEAVYLYQRVTDVRCLQARGYFASHRESYVELRRSMKLPYGRARYYGFIDD